MWIGSASPDAGVELLSQLFLQCMHHEAVLQLLPVLMILSSVLQLSAVLITWLWCNFQLFLPRSCAALWLLQSVIGIFSKPIFRFMIRSWLHRNRKLVRIHSHQFYVNIWKAPSILEFWRWGRSDLFWYLHHSSTSSSSVRLGGGEREGSLKGQQCEIWQLCKLTLRVNRLDGWDLGA